MVFIISQVVSGTVNGFLPSVFKRILKADILGLKLYGRSRIILLGNGACQLDGIRIIFRGIQIFIDNKFRLVASGIISLSGNNHRRFSSLFIILIAQSIIRIFCQYNRSIACKFYHRFRRCRRIFPVFYFADRVNNHIAAADIAGHYFNYRIVAVCIVSPIFCIPKDHNLIVASLLHGNLKIVLAEFLQRRICTGSFREYNVIVLYICTKIRYSERFPRIDWCLASKLQHIPRFLLRLTQISFFNCIFQICRACKVSSSCNGDGRRTCMIVIIICNSVVFLLSQGIVKSSAFAFSGIFPCDTRFNRSV